MPATGRPLGLAVTIGLPALLPVDHKVAPGQHRSPTGRRPQVSDDAISRPLCGRRK